MSSLEVQPGQHVDPRPAAWLAFFKARPYLFAVALIVLTLGLYYQVKSHPFVNYDDNVYVTDNTHIQGGLNWETVSWAFASYDAGNWHPLTWLSHAMDFQLYDQDPGGHHVTSMLLHILNAVLLFWVLWRATGYAARSFMVAALFAVHPINVESVAWISERKTVLSMMFFLLALGAYRWYVSKPRAGRYLVVAALFALGLMAKPQIVTFPFVLLLWDYWPLRRMAVGSQPAADSVFPQKTLFALVEEKLPLFALAAASAVITMKAQRAGGAVLSLASSPFVVRLSNAVVSYVKYMEKALWPAALAPMYPHPGTSIPAWQVYGGLLILLSMTLFVEWTKRPYLLVGWLWFLGTMVPMIGLVQVGRQAMADRYAYLPLLGIFIMICWGAADYVQDKHLPAVLLPAVSCAAILTLMMVAHRQIGYWANNVTLWTHTIRVTPPNYVAQDDLGGALLAENRLEEAIGHFRQAAAIHPVDPISNFNIGFYDQRHGNLEEAIERYKRAVVLTTSLSLKVQAFNNMGLAYRDLGDTEKARECFDAAKRLQGP